MGASVFVAVFAGIVFASNAAAVVTLESTTDEPLGGYAPGDLVTIMLTGALTDPANELAQSIDVRIVGAGFTSVSSETARGGNCFPAMGCGPVEGDIFDWAVAEAQGTTVDGNYVAFSQVADSTSRMLNNMNPGFMPGTSMPNLTGTATLNAVFTTTAGEPGDYSIELADVTEGFFGITGPITLGEYSVGHTRLPQQLLINDLSAGGLHTCAIHDTGVMTPRTVTCWGRNVAGESTVPFGVVNPVAIATGFMHTCTVDDYGVTCWGSDSSGRLTVPAGLVNPSAIAAGYGHTCVLDDNGVTCWGWNSQGQSMVPAGLVNPSAVAAGGFHTCAVDDNGVTCWGSNGSGRSTVPAGLVNPSAIAAGYSHTCAVDDNGVTCWGSDLDWDQTYSGQSTVPAGLVNPTSLTAGWSHTCALDDNGITCWGIPSSGPEFLGGGSAAAAGTAKTTNSGQSTVSVDIVNPSAITAGGAHTCAIHDNGVACWGKDGSGQSTVPAELVLHSPSSVPALGLLGFVALVGGLLGSGLSVSRRRIGFSG